MSFAISPLHGESSHANHFVIWWLRSFRYAPMPRSSHLGSLSMMHMITIGEPSGPGPSEYTRWNDEDSGAMQKSNDVPARPW